MENIKQINIKNRKCYFFNDIINNKNFHSSLLKTIKSQTKTLIFITLLLYYIALHWYLNIYHNKRYWEIESINRANLLNVIIGEVHGYTKEKNENKYLVFNSTDKHKEVLTKYTELWNKIKGLIEKINGKPGDYDKKYMKIKFYLDDNLGVLNSFIF